MKQFYVLCKRSDHAFGLVCPVLTSAITRSKWWSRMCCLGIWVCSRNWKAVLFWYVRVSLSFQFQHWNSCSELLFLRSDQWVGIFLGVCIELAQRGSPNMFGFWLCQPRPRTVATDFHLHIRSGRILAFVSCTGCVSGLEHSTISRVALGCYFAVWSVVGLENTNLSPAPPLWTISCPGKQGSPHLSKVSVPVFCCSQVTMTAQPRQWSFQDLIAQWI